MQIPAFGRELSATYFVIPSSFFTNRPLDFTSRGADWIDIKRSESARLQCFLKVVGFSS